MRKSTFTLRFICYVLHTAVLFVFALTAFGCAQRNSELEINIPEEQLNAVKDRRSMSDGLDKIIVDLPGYEVDFTVHQDYERVGLSLSDQDKASSSKTVSCNGDGESSVFFFGKQGVNVEFGSDASGQAVVSAVIRKGERIAGYAVFAFGASEDAAYSQDKPRVIKAVLFDADRSGYPEPSLKTVNSLIDRTIEQAIGAGLL